MRLALLCRVRETLGAQRFERFTLILSASILALAALYYAAVYLVAR